MLAEFLSWWWAQLAPLVEPVRARLDSRSAWVIRPEPNGSLTVLRRRRGRSSVVASITPGQSSAGLRQALANRRRNEKLLLALPGRPLLREVSLPLAAERSLGSMLTYEIDRLTPFVPSDVVWSHRVLSRDSARGLRVELALAPRAALAPLLTRLDEAGVTPAALEAVGADGIARVLPLSPRDPAALAFAHRMEVAALAACVAIALVLVGLPFLRQSLALADVDARMAALRPAVEHAEALRKRIIDGDAGTGRLAAERAQSAKVLRAVAALTDLLPDDTWLSSLSMRKNQVSIEGHSAQATRLIALLAGDVRLRNPSFIAPVVRDENGTDIFSIRAELAP